MRLPKLAIENHQFTIILVILLILFGLVSFMTMPRSEDPQVSPAASTVIVIYPGANPADMEELVIDPIEEVLNELEDIKHIKSRAEDGLALVNIEFLSGSDPDDKYADVVQKVNSIRSQLPENIVDLEIQKWSVSDVEILQLALLTDSSEYRVLEKEAEKLKKSLERTAGVKKVKVWAYPEQEIRIAIDLQRMAQNQLSLNRVIGAIQTANQNIPGGYLDVGASRFNIRTSGSYATIAEIENTVVHSAENNILYLKDIAEVTPSYEDETYTARFLSKTAVFITVSQKVGTNIFTISASLEEQIGKFKNELPQNLTLDTVFDQSESVAHRLNGFFINLVQGLLLVGLIVFLAVGLRASIIVNLAIPISIMIGIGFVDLSGFGLEQMSIAGLVIALGLLVDNAIVVIENISRFIKLSRSNKEAAVEGTSQIAWAVVSSTTTTVLAFVPIMMMQNITGDFIRSMPVTVVYTLSASLLISLILTPYLSFRFLRKEDTIKESFVRRFLNHEIDNRYSTTLDYALKKPKTIIAIALIVFTVSLGLFPLIGISFFPKAEKPQFIINIDTPDGTNLERTEQVADYVDSLLQTHDEIKHYAINIGHGNPRIYYNIMPRRNTSTHVQFFITMRERDLEVSNNLIKTLRQQLSSFPGAKIEVKEFEQGPPVEAPVAIRIQGDNLDILKSIATDVEQIIKSTDGAININNPLSTSKTDIRVNINREKAAFLGVLLVDIDRTVRASVAGLAISKYRDSEGKEYNIVVRLPFTGKLDFEDLDKIYVSSVSGAQIPLRHLATFDFVASPMSINHYNLERTVTVTSDIEGDLSVDQVTGQIIGELNKYGWPKGYRYSIGGELESREESFGGMMQAVIVAVIGIFAVLVLQFRSYTQPLIVFSAIPLAVIGSMIALFLTGNSFSFTAFIGLASLVGIVVNNSIILVDYTNQLRREGEAIAEALKMACKTRFIPIVLTTATTVGGLLPLTLGGGSLWAPMGWTIIGGLTISTVLTLIVVPVLYLLYSGKESQENGLSI
jgi:multidrug efflux pump subunit AcrB